MPKILSKENGFGTDMISKGHFNVSSYGSSLLFIHKPSPYILIQTNDKPIFINGKNPDQTHIWYEQLKSEIATLKNKLRRFLDDEEADVDEILEINFKIDDLINKFYHLQSKSY